MKQEHKNSKFDKELRKKFENAEFMPPSFQKVMDGMQTELENAWQNNFSEPRKSWKSFMIYSLLIAFLLPLSTLRSDLTLITQQEHTIIAEQISYEDLGTQAGIDTEKSDITTNKKTITPSHQLVTQAKQQKSRTSTITQVAARKDKLPLGKVIPEKNHKFFDTHFTNSTPHELEKDHLTQVLPPLTSFPASVIGGTQETEVLHIPQPQNAVPSVYEQVLLPNVSKGEVYVGLLGSVYSPWILNQNTYGAFNGHEFAYSFNFEQKVSFRAGYNSYGKLGVELGFIINSHQGQHYEDHILGKLQTREVALDYWQIPLLLKYRTQLQQRQSPTVFNIEFGLAYNHLKSAKEIVNHGVGIDISERFKQSIIQGMLGLSTDFYFSDRFFATVGLRSYFSNDINARGWEVVNDHYQKSHSIVLSAELGISYRLAR
ncbi:MAG: hypothetical protein ACPGJS_03165 [Flammeovirgaceae bacterium]